MEEPRIPTAAPLTAPILPTPLPLETPILELPKAEVPSYKPLYFPFNSQLIDDSVPLNNAKAAEETPEKKPAPPVIQAITAPPPSPIKTEYQSNELPLPSTPQPQLPEPQLAEATTINLPGTDIQVPVPKAEIVAAAAVTSVVS